MRQTILTLLLIGQVALVAPGGIRAEDYADCRIRCETEQADCSNQAPAPEPEVQAAKMANCDRMLQICYGECENLKPVEPTPNTEYNPDIIYKPE